jgi:hypothetical protein
MSGAGGKIAALAGASTAVAGTSPTHSPTFARSPHRASPSRRRAPVRPIPFSGIDKPFLIHKAHLYPAPCRRRRSAAEGSGSRGRRGRGRAGMRRAPRRRLPHPAEPVQVHQSATEARRVHAQVAPHALRAVPEENKQRSARELPDVAAVLRRGVRDGGAGDAHGGDAGGQGGATGVEEGAGDDRRRWVRGRGERPMTGIIIVFERSEPLKFESSIRSQKS